jgi:hypothetical protein
MAESDRLEVDQDLRFQQRDWTFERAGWIGILAVITAALLGFLGRGVLSDRTHEAADRSLQIEYGRFERHGAAALLEITLRRRAPGDSSVWLWIAEEYLDGVHLESIAPQPLTQRSVGEQTLYEIGLESGADSARVTVSFTPAKIGARDLRLGVAGAQPLDLSQFVYP